MVRNLIPNSTQVPDVILDHWMSALSGAELKVLLYVARRTYGFGKAHDRISLQQLSRGIRRRDGSVLDRGTGLSVSSVARAVKSLEERGLLVRELNVDTATGEHEQTTYHLNLDFAGSLGRTGTSQAGRPSRSPRGAGERVLPESKDVLLGSGGGSPILGEGVLPESEIQETDQETEQETAAEGAAAGLVSALVAEDMNQEDAVRLAATHPVECRRQLAYLAYKRAELRGSPGAWLRCAIEGAYGPPAGYRRARTAAVRRARSETQAAGRAARGAHEAAHGPAYTAYVAQVMGEMSQTQTELWAEFQLLEAETRAGRARAPVSPVAVARCLAAFDDPASRRERFMAFFGARGLVLDFWTWDRTLNPAPFVNRQTDRTADVSSR